MEKITSFTVNHLDLEPGVYVSRKDAVGGETVTTFALRLTAPNKEPVMNTAEIHTLEHLGATFLRNHSEFGDKVLYFGPMGCRTGFYLLLRRELFLFTRDFRGEVPGAAARDCGNYLDMNLPMANWESARYLERALNAPKASQLRYPE